MLLLLIPPALLALPQHAATSSRAFAHAGRLREALEGRPERQRSRAEYERVLDAYRSIYHGDPASPKADASIAAVADLLAEEGRVFQDDKALHDAIGQYEFLRRQYPASRYRFSALLAEGEIDQRDLNDPTQAKSIYESFLRLYPRHPLAVEARAELRTIRRDQLAAARIPPFPKSQRDREGSLATPIPASRHDAGSTAEARSSAPPQTSRQEAAPRETAGRAARPKEESAPPPVPASQTPEYREHPAPDAEAAPQPAALQTLRDAPPTRDERLPLITGIRHWSTPVYTRVAIDLQKEVRYEAARVPSPDRIFFDLYGARLSPELSSRSVEVTDDGFLTRIRAAQFSSNITRIVLDVNSVSEYSAFFLQNPPRLIIDVHGGPGLRPPARQEARVAPAPAAPVVRDHPLPPSSATAAAQPAPRTPAAGLPATRPARQAVTPPAFNPKPVSAPPRHAESSPAVPTRIVDDGGEDSSSLAEVATLSRHPGQVRATRHPTTAPVVASVPAAKPSADLPAPAHAAVRPFATSAATSAAASGDDDVPPAEAGDSGIALAPAQHLPNSMVRALGLKINRIVIDAGHGGHDSGTLGPGGIEEKNVVLNVALRLGRLLKDRLGADVIYTRDDDTFIPLETRTAIANQAQADLFISIHANSSSDSDVRGVEVYYLNFTTSADALEVAARENAASDESIHQLSDLVKKIALQDKISESRAFATDVDQSLYDGLERGNAGLRDRGVKKAPFVVLIGANMPSILAEISFLTNPDDARELRQPQYCQRIAESLYRGVARYVASLNGVRVAQAAPRARSSQ